MTALARLAPKTLIPNGEGSGGHIRLEQCDVAYGLAGLDPGPAALLRAMYGGDTDQQNVVTAQLWAWQESINLAIDGRWTIPRGRELLRILSTRAVQECIQPGLGLCPHCNGSKSVQPNQHNQTGDCRLCAGTGRRTTEAEEMAELASMSEIEWRQVWAIRYASIQAMLREWQTHGLRHVRQRLSRGD